ncbi:MAG TPA: nucleoside monophosphate kinase [Candidatus Paceibacterota bacterium]
MNGKTFVFFGIVGSGKGTQVKLLQDFLAKHDGRECVYAGTGEGFRAMVGSGSYAGKLLQEKMHKGELIDDFFANSIIGDILSSKISPEKHLILDGYPRTVAQSKVLEDMMKFYKHDDIKIVFIKLSKEEAMRRNLLRGRHDDTEAGLAKRFEEYEVNVVPAMNYFKGHPGYTIYEINGEQSVEAVHADILKALGF